MQYSNSGPGLVQKINSKDITTKINNWFVLNKLFKNIYVKVFINFLNYLIDVCFYSLKYRLIKMSKKICKNKKPKTRQIKKIRQILNEYSG